MKDLREREWAAAVRADGRERTTGTREEDVGAADAAAVEDGARVRR